MPLKSTVAYTTPYYNIIKCISQYSLLCRSIYHLAKHMSLHDLQQGKCQNHLTLLRERERERVQIVQERLKQQEGQQRSCGRFWAYHGPQSPGSTEQEIFTLFSTTIKHGIDAVSMSQQAHKQLTLFLARTLKKNDGKHCI